MFLRKLLCRCYSQQHPLISKVNRTVASRRSTSATSCPSIQVSKPEVMVDEKVKITVGGLHSNQKVSLLSTLKENDKIFASCGHYVADDRGQVDTFVDRSHGGSFTDVQPSGLFTSPREPFGSSRLMKLDVTTPYDVTLSIHDGHLDFETLAVDFTGSRVSPMAVTSLKRWYMAPGVKKSHVRAGRLRGTLLLPPGDGPFPGLLDVFGMAGGIFDYRAALLASHGFATFHLAYISYDDLAKNPQDLDITYFMEAVDWLSCQPVIIPGGVGIVGHCYGGSNCIAAATFNPKVKYLVAINSNPFIMIPGIHEYNGIRVESVEWDMSKCTFTDKGVIQKDAYRDISIKEHLTPIWKTDVKTLVIVGEEDLCVDPQWQRDLEAAIPPDKKDNFRFVYYPGAGHLIEPPYSPHCEASYNKIINVTHLWGGNPEYHLPAQEDAWREILAFLNKHSMKMKRSRL